MAKLTEFNTINSIMEGGDVLQEKRPYLGYSGIGRECMREIWYAFRWVDDVYISRRIDRIFRRGDIEEERIIRDLESVGCTVSNIQREVIGVTGHAKGHIDGEAIGVPTSPKTLHLFESKTMKADQYKKYIKDGLRKFNNGYWQQIHSYMGHLKLTRCLYVVVNKDTEERDYQRIKFDRNQFDEGERIAFNIITADKPPPKIPNSSTKYFKCRICGYNEICHRGKPVIRNCRTCKYWSIEDGGKFSCDLRNTELDYETQLVGCEDYDKDSCYI